MSFEPTSLVLDEGGIISEDVKQFLSEPPVDITGKQFVVVCIDWNFYGLEKYSINSICASFLKFDGNGALDLASLLIGTTKSDMLLPAQKVAIRDWIMAEVQKDAGDIQIWKRTYSHVKQFIR